MSKAPKPTTTVRWAWAMKHPDGLGNWLVDWDHSRKIAVSERADRVKQGYVCGPVTKIELPLPRVTK